MKSYEHIEADGFESQTERYAKIEALNRQSFLLTEGSSLQVLQSLHSAGASREILTKEFSNKYNSDVIAEAQRVGRVILAGNMSPLNNYGPSSLSAEGRIEDAASNLKKFFSLNDIDPSDIRLVRPERDYTTPLTLLNVDTESLTPDDTGLLRPDISGDMLYTYNSDVIFAARPADCPVAFVTAETPKGDLTALLHLATLGVAHGYIPQSKQMFDSLGVDWKTVRVQLTPGGHGETYNFENFIQYDPRKKFPESGGLFINVKEAADEKGDTTYGYGVDVAAETYEKIIEQWGIDAYQIFLDTTDTTSPTSGYSSNSLSFKGYEVDGDNTRDIVLAKREPSLKR